MTAITPPSRRISKMAIASALVTCLYLFVVYIAVYCFCNLPLMDGTPRRVFLNELHVLFWGFLAVAGIPASLLVSGIFGFAACRSMKKNPTTLKGRRILRVSLAVHFAVILFLAVFYWVEHAWVEWLCDHERSNIAAIRFKNHELIDMVAKDTALTMKEIENYAATHSGRFPDSPVQVATTPELAGTRYEFYEYGGAGIVMTPVDNWKTWPDKTLVLVMSFSYLSEGLVVAGIIDGKGYRQITLSQPRFEELKKRDIQSRAQLGLTERMVTTQPAR